MANILVEWTLPAHVQILKIISLSLDDTILDISFHEEATAIV